MVRNEQWSWNLHVWKFQCLYVENIRYEHVELGAFFHLILFCFGGREKQQNSNFAVTFYGRKTRPVSFRERHILRALQSRVLKTVLKYTVHYFLRNLNFSCDDIKENCKCHM